MKIKLVTVVVVLRLNDIVQHIIRYRRKKMPSANKTSNGKGEFGGGPRGPRLPLLWFIKYFSIT